MSEHNAGISSGLAGLQTLVARLRADCPWDRQQSHASMRAYFMEEFYEALDAIDREDPIAMKEELGDLLFQIFFHARLAEEHGHFDISAVADAITQKMITRHPHVFEDTSLPGGPGVWETRKAARRSGSRIDGVPKALPALLRAHRVGEKLAHIGFDWPDTTGVFDKLEEERLELLEAIASKDADAIRHEYGDLLLTVASLGRHLGISGEDALREANTRFEGRFRKVEALASAAQLSLEEAGSARLEEFWAEAKRT